MAWNEQFYCICTWMFAWNNGVISETVISIFDILRQCNTVDFCRLITIVLDFSIKVELEFERRQNYHKVFHSFFNRQDESGNNDRLFLIRERSRQFTGSTLLLILAAFCLACMGLLIGLVVYRRVQLQRMHFRGMCNLPYDGNFDDNKDMLYAMNRRFQDLENLYVLQLVHLQQFWKFA